jgi:hypothetical protein
LAIGNLDHLEPVAPGASPAGPIGAETGTQKPKRIGENAGTLAMASVQA